MPRADAAQKVGEIRLTGPGASRLERGGTYNNRYAYFEVENPGSTLKVAAPATSDCVSTTAPSTDAVTVPPGLTPVAETVTSIDEVPLSTSTEAGVGVAVRMQWPGRGPSMG